MPDARDDIGYKGLPAAYSGVLNIFERAPSMSPRGSYHVWEIYGESVVPLAVDQKYARLIELNMAARYANYQGSGGVMAWKLGLDWSPLDELRFRATRSRDVRAGTLSERFDTTRGPGTVLDPFTNNRSQVFSQIAGGNPDVDPEKADTLTFGVVWQPAWLPGFGVTTDFYDIDIKDAIGQLTVQNIVDRCFAGVQSQCEWITRDDEGSITQIRNVFINIARARTRGVDFEAFYGHSVSLFGGNEQVRLRAFATYVAESSTVARVARAEDRSRRPDGRNRRRAGLAGQHEPRLSAQRLLREPAGALHQQRPLQRDVHRRGHQRQHSGCGLLHQPAPRLRVVAERRHRLRGVCERHEPVRCRSAARAESHLHRYGAYQRTSLFDTIGRRYNLGVSVKF